MTHPTIPCAVCLVPLVPGIDAHDDGLDDLGRERVVCAEHCRGCDTDP